MVGTAPVVDLDGTGERFPWRLAVVGLLAGIVLVTAVAMIPPTFINPPEEALFAADAEGGPPMSDPRGRSCTVQLPSTWWHQNVLRDVGAICDDGEVVTTFGGKVGPTCQRRAWPGWETIDCP